MTDDEIRMLACLVIRQHRSAGEMITREGEECRSLFFLAQGRVSVLSETNGRTLRLASYRAGVTFGEMALLSDQPQEANVVAETSIVLLELTTDAFERLNCTQPVLGGKLMRNLAVELSFRLRCLDDRVRALEA